MHSIPVHYHVNPESGIQLGSQMFTNEHMVIQNHLSCTSKDVKKRSYKKLYIKGACVMLL